MSFNPRLIQVIETWEIRGAGNHVSPFRRIRTFWTTDGEYLGEGPDPEDAAKETTGQQAETPKELREQS